MSCVKVFSVRKKQRSPAELNKQDTIKNSRTKRNIIHVKHKIAVSVKFSRHVCFEIVRVANKLYSALLKYCDFTKDFSFEPFKLNIFGKTKFLLPEDVS